jgi:NitT/TauT family transport system substrate-binding protein
MINPMRAVMQLSSTLPIGLPAAVQHKVMRQSDWHRPRAGAEDGTETIAQSGGFETAHFPGRPFLFKNTEATGDRRPGESHPVRSDLLTMSRHVSLHRQRVTAEVDICWPSLKPTGSKLPNRGPPAPAGARTWRAACKETAKPTAQKPKLLTSHREGSLMINRSFSRPAMLALVSGLTFAATGSVALAQTKIVLRTDFKFNGYDSPYVLAIARGFYKQAGLDVSVEPGQGSATTVQTVASGVDTFGLADSGTTVLGISAQNVPVKILAVYSQTNTMGFIYHPDQDFDGKLTSLKGKVVISSAGTADAKLLAPTLATAGMTLDDVKLQLVNIGARVPLFLQSPGAFLTGFETGDLLRARMKLPGAKYIPYAKYGVIAYGTGLIVSTATLAKSPDMVRKFVAASQKGWEAAAKDPEAAIDASLKLYPDLSKDFLLTGLKMSLDDELHTPNTNGHPVGWTSAADWKKMLAMLQKYSGIMPKPLSAYYTNEFIVQ